MVTNLSKDFDAFLKVWNKLNYDRTKDEQEFCLAFKRQIIPTMIRLVGCDNYNDAQKKLYGVSYGKQVKMTWSVMRLYERESSRKI